MVWLYKWFRLPPVKDWTQVCNRKKQMSRSRPRWKHSAKCSWNVTLGAPHPGLVEKRNKCIQIHWKSYPHTHTHTHHFCINSSWGEISFSPLLYFFLHSKVYPALITVSDDVFTISHTILHHLLKTKQSPMKHSAFWRWILFLLNWRPPILFGEPMLMFRGGRWILSNVHVRGGQIPTT